MATDVTSRHLRSASELQLLVPVRNEFVENTEQLTSYATRLKLLLETLSETIRVAWERDLVLPTIPIDTLQSIHVTQWSVKERPEGSLLFVSSCFDRSWEEYFHLLVDRTGSLLDLIFLHCQDYAGKSCADGYEAFASFIRSSQLQNSFFYMTAPDLSVDDQRRARKLLGRGHPSHAPLGTVYEEASRHLEQRLNTDPGLPARMQAAMQRAVLQLQMLRTLFPAQEMFPVPAQEMLSAKGPRKVQDMFDEGIASVLSTYLSMPPDDAVNPLRELPAESALWVAHLRDVAKETLERSRPKTAERTPDPPPKLELELEDVQGNILEAYSNAKVNVGCVLLVQCDDATKMRDLLALLKPEIASASTELTEKQAKIGYLNVAITYEGLRRLGLPESQLSALPKEFREGMESRAGLIGDIGYPNAPEFWQRPPINWPPQEAPARASDPDRLSLSSVDLVIQWQGMSDLNTWHMEERVRRIEAKFNGKGHILHVQELRRVGNSHFGLRETTPSQPTPWAILNGKPPAGVPERDRLPLGELLLGYKDNRGDTAALARQPDSLFKNGSFLVMRKLYQDVGAFEAYVARANEELAPSNTRELIGGVTVHGTALAQLSGEKPNDFDYRDDAAGTQCPLHAHTRLANPRTPLAEAKSASDLVPRIVRRSFAYGPAYEHAPQADRGLLFMAYNASIAGQFEIIQRWLNAGNSTGLQTTQNDLLTGTPQPTGAERCVFVDNKWHALPEPLQPLVQLHWGIYLFVPSRKAIDALSGSERSLVQTHSVRPGTAAGEGAAAVEAVKQGKAIIARLNQLPADDARRAWKQLVEGVPTQEAKLVWMAVAAEEKGWIQATNYASLVARQDVAKQILSDRGGMFSVREYYERLHSTLGIAAGRTHYLAFDPVIQPNTLQKNVASGQYAQLANVPDSLVHGLDALSLYQNALAESRALLASNPDGTPLPLLLKSVVAKIAEVHIGLPDSNLGVLQKLINISRYAFQPYPDEALAKEARTAREELEKAYDGYATMPLGIRILAKKKTNTYRGEDCDVKVAIMGAMVGFAAPAIGCMFNVATLLEATGEMGRLHAQYLQSKQPEHLSDLARRALLDALLKVPVPPLLYRSALKGNELGIPEGLVVMGLAAVAATGQKGQSASDMVAWIFGGSPAQDVGGETAKNPAPHHGCPARDPALSVMSGVLASLIELKELRLSGGVLSWR